MNIPEHIAAIYLKNMFASSATDIEEEKEFFKNMTQKGVKNNSILIIEPNNCHSECLPSYVKYFLQIGFNVDLFISKKNSEENSFSKCNFSSQFRVFFFRKLYSQPEFFEYLKNYRYILLSSLTFYGGVKQNYSYYANLLKDKYIEAYGKNNVFVINHEVDFTYETAGIECYFKDRTFTLRPNIRKDSMSVDFPFITASYFGIFDNLQKYKKKGYAKFLCVGGVDKKNLRNFSALINTTRKLSQNYFRQFEIVYVGKPDKEFEKIVKLDNLSIKLTGRINFSDMYQYVIESDFILFNIDKNSIEYERYLNKKITGSYSLSLGFLRPGIIDSGLSKSYNLDGGSITYSSENFYEAMQNAIQMDSYDYKNLQKYLDKLNCILTKKSLINIKRFFIPEKIPHSIYNVKDYLARR